MKRKFGWSVKTKEAIVITFLTLLVVTGTTVIHLSQLIRVILGDVQEQTELIHKQIFDKMRFVLEQEKGKDPQQVLGKSEDLRRLIEASVGYSPHLLYGLIADNEGKAFLHSEKAKTGRIHSQRPGLTELIQSGPLDRFLIIFQEGLVYDSTFPMTLNEEPFGSVILGIHTSLLRERIFSSMTTGIIIAIIALPFAWLLAYGVAAFTLKPIHLLAQQMEQLRQGDFEILTDLGRSDEFRELADQLQLLGQQLKSDRLKMLSSQSDFQGVIDHLEDAILLVNAEGRILFGNSAMRDILGREPSGRMLGEISEALHALVKVIEEGLRQQTFIEHQSISLFIHENPKQFYVFLYPLADHGVFKGILVVLRNHESVKTLQALIGYAAKLTTFGRLTAGVAHEVKNPLNSMMIHLELLKEEMGARQGQTQKYLDIIEGDIHRLDHVIQGFLKFMRPQDLHLALVDVNDVVNHEIELLEAEWKPKGIRFHRRLDAHLPSITADRDLLGQVILNVLLNGCQAMKNGGNLTVLTEPKGADSICIIIGDGGCGISPEHQGSIFKLYFTTKPNGSGMGLAMAYRIVQLHEGIIEVTSQPDQGTTMTITLPLRP